MPREISPRVVTGRKGRRVSKCTKLLQFPRRGTFNLTVRAMDITSRTFVEAIARAPRAPPYRSRALAATLK